MNFKKRVNGSWIDTPHYIHNTSTDTITTLPAIIYPNDTTATVGLKGNTVQNGTPSPTTPIQPQECGERTGNLLATLTEKYAIDASGNINSNSAFMYYTAPCEANETYTFSLDSGLSGNTVRIHAFDGDTWIGQLKGEHIANAPFTVTTPANTTNLKISITKLAKTYHTMLNVGETALLYEPYGIKIPISSANTTTNIYLGEVQTTRRIKKLVLTGEENFSNQYSTNLFSVVIQPLSKTNVFNSYCTHYKYNPVQSGLNVNTQNGEYALQVQSTQSLLAFKDISYSSAADFKTYLAAQYAAGTPVCVWYVLAEPTTGIVNEPLRKIGDYADTVSGITIPVTAGANTISIDTQVQPSEVAATYKGWHPVSAVHERESGAWD